VDTHTLYPGRPPHQYDSRISRKYSSSSTARYITSPLHHFSNGAPNAVEIFADAASSAATSSADNRHPKPPAHKKTQKRR
jgi:hypothetical protein